MTDPAEIRRMTAAEYLAWEHDQPHKHEFHHGEVFAMAGGSPRHNFLSAAVAGELRLGLRGTGCHVLSSDQRIAAEPGGRYVYADAVVVCGALQTEPGTRDVLRNPKVIVEVLSKSSETYDRGEKWAAYQRLGSLTDYLLVAQGSAKVEHFRRDADGSWRYRLLGAGDAIALDGGVTVTVDRIYEGAFDLDGDEGPDAASGGARGA
jgi:Uma2 family endonuclease